MPVIVLGSGTVGAHKTDKTACLYRAYTLVDGDRKYKENYIVC